MSVPSKVQKYCDKVRGEVERQSPKSFDTYEAVNFKYMEKHDGSEAYFVKIKVDDDDDDDEGYVHVKIVVEHDTDCGKRVLLKDVQLKKSSDDDLQKF